MGVAILAMVLLLLMLVRTTARMADAKTKLEDELSSKVDKWYIDTGTVSAFYLLRIFPCLPPRAWDQSFVRTTNDHLLWFSFLIYSPPF